jgi:hypothetical protein
MGPLTNAKDLGQIVALFAAAGFFLYKLVSGYLIGNTSLRFTCVRAPSKSQPGLDHLGIIAVLKRGAGSTLWLHDARARVTYAQGQTLPDTRTLLEARSVPAAIDTHARLIAAERLSSLTTSGGVLRVKFDELSAQSPLLNVAPGDEMQFATLYEVDATRPCIVEVAILGRSWATSKRSQWRASDISLPNSCEKS